MDQQLPLYPEVGVVHRVVVGGAGDVNVLLPVHSGEREGPPTDAGQIREHDLTVVQRPLEHLLGKVYLGL